jgi:hypothetical protein
LASQGVEEFIPGENDVVAFLVDPLDLIELRPQQRIGEYFEGEFDGLVLVFIPGFGVFRMIFLGQLVIRDLNRFRSGSGVDPEKGVVILELAGKRSGHKAALQIGGFTAGHEWL